MCKWSKNPQAVEYSLTVLERLADRYRDEPMLYGIEVLNEPISWLVYATAPSTGKAKNKQEAKGSGYVPLRFLKPFYREAYSRLRSKLRPEHVIVFHDGFRLGSWNRWFKREGMKNVILDTHIYITAMELFVPIHAMWLYRLFVGYNAWLIRRVERHIPVVVGEWCLVNKRALTVKGEEAKRHVYRGVNDLQMAAWNASAGQIYWNYQLLRDDTKTPRNYRTNEELEAWDLSRAWRHGWVS